MLVLQVFTSNDYNTNLLYYVCKKMALNQESTHFVLCPKQGMYFRIFCPKGDQGFKASAATVDKERVVKKKISWL